MHICEMCTSICRCSYKVFCMSYIGNNFRDYCSSLADPNGRCSNSSLWRCEWISGMYPSLVSCTTAIWLLPWPAEALTEVALKFLTEGLCTWLCNLNRKVCSCFMFACILLLPICWLWWLFYQSPSRDTSVHCSYLVCVMCLVPGELEESLRPPVAEIFGTAHTTVMRFSTRIYQVHNSNRASAKTVRVISCHMTTSYLGWNYATGAEAHELCDAHQLPRARSGLHEDVEGLSKWDWVRVYQVYGTTTDPKVMWSGCISIHA